MASSPITLINRFLVAGNDAQRENRRQGGECQTKKLLIIQFGFESVPKVSKKRVVRYVFVSLCQKRSRWEKPFIPSMTPGRGGRVMNCPGIRK
jgi:hypothetical protein